MSGDEEIEAQRDGFATFIATVRRIFTCAHPEVLVVPIRNGLQVCTECGSWREGDHGKYTRPLRVQAVRIALEKLGALFGVLVIAACGATVTTSADAAADVASDVAADVAAATDAATCRALPSRDAECGDAGAHAFTCNVGGCADESARGLWCCP